MKKILILSVIAALTQSTVLAQDAFRTDFKQEIRTTDSCILPYSLPSATSSDGLGVYGVSARGTVESIGSPVVPVLLVSFADRDFMPTSTDEKFVRWFNEKGYNDERFCMGSVADYFCDNSYGMFTPRFEVVKRIALSHDVEYYGGKTSASPDSRRQEMVTEAIDRAVAEGVDFSGYSKDGNGVPLVAILFAGPGEQEDYGPDAEKYMWAHYNGLGYTRDNLTYQSYLMINESFRDFDNYGNVTNEYMTGIGTFCHEFCHALGLPDIYDIKGNGSHTPQFWDVMDYQFMYNGFRPGCLNAYERCYLGWLEPTLLTADEEGIFTLEPLDVDDDYEREGSKAYILRSPANDSEYFIMENRQHSRWHVAHTSKGEKYMGSGMLVWHIDYSSGAWISNSVNVTPAHQRVEVVCADGEWQPKNTINDHSSFPGDLFPGTKDVKQFDRTLAEFYSGEFDTVLHTITEHEDGTVTFVIGKEREESVSIIEFAPANLGTIYDFSGRRMKNNSERLYISGGRKFIK